MGISNHADVIIATEGPDTTALAAAEPVEPEHVDVAPDPDRRFIVLAPTKQAGAEHAASQGIDPVAIVTPRSMYGARGLVVDEIIEAPGLSTEERAELMAETLPALATSSAD